MKKYIFVLHLLMIFLMSALCAVESEVSSEVLKGLQDQYTSKTGVASDIKTAVPSRVSDTSTLATKAAESLASDSKQLLSSLNTTINAITMAQQELMQLERAVTQELRRPLAQRLNPQLLPKVGGGISNVDVINDVQSKFARNFSGQAYNLNVAFSNKLGALRSIAMSIEMGEAYSSDTLQSSLQELEGVAEQYEKLIAPFQNKSFYQRLMSLLMQVKQYINELIGMVQTTSTTVQIRASQLIS